MKLELTNIPDAIQEIAEPSCAVSRYFIVYEEVNMNDGTTRLGIAAPESVMVWDIEGMLTFAHRMVDYDPAED